MDLSPISSDSSRDSSSSPEPADISIVESPTSVTSSLDELAADSSGHSSQLRPLRSVYRSPVWNFFIIAEDSKYAKCKTCLDLVARGGNNPKSALFSASPTDRLNFNHQQLQLHCQLFLQLPLLYTYCSPCFLEGEYL